MSLDVIGAGLPRTGTESLKHALEIIGFRKCYHMVDLIAHPEHLPQWESASAGGECDWEQLFDGYRAAVDFPAMYHWRQLAARYPQAKVVLSVRDAASWYESLCNTILTAIEQIPHDDPHTARRRALVRRDLVGGLFAGRCADRAFMLGLFERHCAEVRASIPRERLLVFEARAGWSPLCEFLGVPVPNSAYPRGNATAEFRAKYLRRE